MTYAAFISAVLALLLAPGPTNTLMALAGARDGLRRVVRLLPAEVLGYSTAILPLAWMGGEMLANWPLGAVLLKAAAAGWVLFLSWKLWGAGAGQGDQQDVTARRVYLTTVLNPKALVFGLVLLPAPADSGFWPKVWLLGALVLLVAVTWGMLGRLTQLGGDGAGRLRVVRRVASVWLAMVSVTLIAGALRA